MLSGEKITVSVLIPTFNRSFLLKKALDCVLMQTYENIQIVIYDDGSYDNTCSMINNYFINKSKIMHYFRTMTNNGVAYARNRLLEYCRTEYACWWDSDDLSNTHRIEKQVEEIQKGYDIIFTAFKSFKNKNTPDFTEVPRKQKTPFAFASMLFKVDKSILFDENKRFGGEDCAWSRQMQRKYRTIHIPEILYYVRHHSKRIGAIKTKMKKQDKSKTYAEVENRICSR